MLFSMMIQYFIDTYGWRSTLALLGAILLNGFPLAIIIVPPQTKDTNHTDGKSAVVTPKLPQENSSSDRVENMEVADDCKESKSKMWLVRVYRIFDFTLFKDIMIAMLVLKKFLNNMGYIIIFMFLPIATVQNGIDTTTTAGIMSLVGFASFAGRFVFGVLGNIKKLDSVYLFCGSAIICGVATLIVPSLSTSHGFSIIAGIFGFNYGEYSLSSVFVLIVLG